MIRSVLELEGLTAEGFQLGFLLLGENLANLGVEFLFHLLAGGTGGLTIGSLPLLSAAPPSRSLPFTKGRKLRSLLLGQGQLSRDLLVKHRPISGPLDDKLRKSGFLLFVQYLGNLRCQFAWIGATGRPISFALSALPSALAPLGDQSVDFGLLIGREV